jgi:pyrroline-5-carboxylate reductase
MKEIGFIGFGSMGGMLVNGFLNSKALRPGELLISTRTLSKAECIRKSWPEVEISHDNSDTVKKCRRIVLCVKPGEVKPLLDEVGLHLREGLHIISIAACVTLADFASIHRGKTTKVIPSLTSEMNEGISLVCHNEKVTPEDAVYLEKLFGSISTVKTIREKDFEAAADLTSCAPGLIAAIFQEFLEAGLRNSGLSRAEAEEMVVKTLYGTARLLKDRGMSFEEAIARVATKGGITEEGVKVLKSGLPRVFDQMFVSTLKKHEKRKSEIRAQFRDGEE